MKAQLAQWGAWNPDVAGEHFQGAYGNAKNPEMARLQQQIAQYEAYMKSKGWL
jgi:hypothetical protein